MFPLLVEDEAKKVGGKALFHYRIRLLVLLYYEASTISPERLSLYAFPLL
jgi:hypothetical protein